MSSSTTIIERAKCLEVEKKLDGESSSWEERYSIVRNIEDKILELHHDKRLCSDGDRVVVLEEIHMFREQLERIKRL